MAIKWSNVVIAVVLAILLAWLAVMGYNAYVGSTEVVTIETTVPINDYKLTSGKSLDNKFKFVADGTGNQFIVQEDGNIVIYNRAGKPIWDAGSFGPGVKLSMQVDGNLVAVDSTGRALWNSVTFGNPGAYLVFKGDVGKFIIYKADGTVLKTL